MYSMKDAVMSHAQKVKHGGSTGEAIEFLELPNSHQYNAAGNLYLSALSIINAAQQSMHLTCFPPPPVVLHLLPMVSTTKIVGWRKPQAGNTAVGRTARGVMMEKRKYHFRDEEPCNHPGCQNHISHPCENCGRIGARGEVEFERWFYPEYEPPNKRVQADAVPASESEG